jgi:hypothetical protein
MKDNILFSPQNIRIRKIYAKHMHPIPNTTGPTQKYGIFCAAIKKMAVGAVFQKITPNTTGLWVCGVWGGCPTQQQHESISAERKTESHECSEYKIRSQILNTLQQLSSTILKWKKPCHVLPCSALPCHSLCCGDVQRTKILCPYFCLCPYPYLCPCPCLLPIPLPLKGKASPLEQPSRSKCSPYS